jgi:hypothetical protein
MEQNEVPINSVDSNYIREWLILGPFFPAELDADFLADVGGEANVAPKEGDTVTTADGKMLTWERHVSKRDVIDFVDAIGDIEDATAGSRNCRVDRAHRHAFEKEFAIAGHSGGNDVAHVSVEVYYAHGAHHSSRLQKHFRIGAR